MGILELVAELQEKLAQVQNAAQAIADEAFAKGKEAGKVEGFEAGKVEGFEAGKLEGYAKGFEDGKNTVPVPAGEKIFSQADLDSAIESAVSPLRAEVEAIKGENEALKAEGQAVKLELEQLKQTAEQDKMEAVQAKADELKGKIKGFIDQENAHELAFVESL